MKSPQLTTNLIFTMTSIAANGITIAYEIHQPTHADSNPRHSQYVVLINGLADPKETWALQVPSLTSSGYHVLTFDNRGIGDTSCPAGPYTAALLALDAKAVVTTLSISKFHLMGVSMGGMIAQSYALAYPSDLLSLTLACTYAAPGKPDISFKATSALLGGGCNLDW